MISPVAIGTTATRLPAGNPSRANHCPCNLIFGNVFCRKESPAISIFKLRAFICYPCFGRAARANGLPLVSYPFQLAWHGLFVSHWKGYFRYHSGTIPKQLRFSRINLKNLFTSRTVYNAPKPLPATMKRPARKHGKCVAMRHADTPESFACDSAARNRGTSRRTAQSNQKAISAVQSAISLPAWLVCFLYAF
jgi:hypothetical protein